MMPSKKSLMSRLKDMGFVMEEHSAKNGKKKKHEMWVNEDLKAQGCPYATTGACLGTKDSGRESKYMDKLARDIASWKSMVENAGSK